MWRYGEGDTYSDDEGYYYDPNDQVDYGDEDEDEVDEEEYDQGIFYLLRAYNIIL